MVKIPWKEIVKFIATVPPLIKTIENLLKKKQKEPSNDFQILQDELNKKITDQLQLHVDIMKTINIRIIIVAIISIISIGLSIFAILK